MPKKGYQSITVSQSVYDKVVEMAQALNESLNVTVELSVRCLKEAYIEKSKEAVSHVEEIKTD